MPVVLEKRGNIALITLDRPDRRNAMDGAMTREMRAVLAEFEADPELRVGILSGRGKVFCAGMDLAAFASGEAEEILRGQGRFGGFVAAERTKPVIAAVHGAALAGGLEIMLACDMVIAAEGTLFGLPEAKRGLVAGAGGAFRLTRRLPHVLANQILLTGDPIACATALAHGMINAVVPADALIDEALKLAGTIAANAPLSLRHSLSLSKMANDGDEVAEWAMNDRLWPEIEASEDATEGSRAFVEKRAAVWKGR
ncbi:enoyl-CoA hydratase-related protein [Chachezhania sediminis]|uniref:enoyl-CoA hydratase-related protein n=1 Tax=Chachezhania sediminis TaxID=2599291 RepID=UPI00131B962B|nr:enoyl-CoA hydratase-related protein [Chachezhania sediminis]